MMHGCVNPIDKYDLFRIIVKLPEPGGEVLTIQTSW